MPFPSSPRVFYEKNPLFEVVCQLRFPPVLRIDAEAPVAFQERVRGAFPLYQHTVQQAFGPGLPQQVLQLLGPIGNSAHEFTSADGHWKLSLTKDFVALTTDAYREWSEFRQKLNESVAAVREVYDPAFFQRVGLRYRDRIRRSKLGLENVPWHELFRAEVLGELGNEALAPHVETALRELVVRLTEHDGRVRILHGLETERLADGREESTYIIDADFYREAQTATGGGLDVLDSFNRRAGNLFRWAIRERLHNAMDPRTPPER